MQKQYVCTAINSVPSL